MGHNGFQVWKLRHPAQLLARQRGVGHQAGWVTVASGRVAHGNGPAGHALGGVNLLLHRKACAIAQVVALAARALRQALQRQPVRLAQVVDVDVVADAGAIGCVVVAAKHGKYGSQCSQHLP
jgi:hypothetical protein